MYLTANELISACRDQGASIYEVTLTKEANDLGLSQEEVLQPMRKAWKVMEQSSKEALDKPTYSLSGMTGGNAYKMNQYRKKQPLSGSSIADAMAYALSVSEINAHMGQIVAAPTAGAAGIIPAALQSWREHNEVSDDTLLEALVVAGAIGAIITANATVSGAEGGCQVECGSASAMAAAALVHGRGGSPEACLNAAGFALISVMGLVCDPIGGLVEYPCALRNASGVANAFVAADLALADVTALVPFDEVVETLYEVGISIPHTLRETALGGLAVTPSGQAAYQTHLK